MRESREKAPCPFCGKLIDIPQKIKTALGDIIGGRCECGAVYVFDRSGHNLGQAFVDALNFACEGKCDDPWELIPGKDYLEILSYYDPRSHTLKQREGGRAPENICFIFLKKDNSQ